MFTHRTIWEAIDSLAERHQLSPSGLARRAGLDATAFNRSKRIGKDGRLRWPSTESISKILSATGEEIESFLSYGAITEKADSPSQTLPLLGMAEASSEFHFDDAGHPSGGGWDEIMFPGGPEVATYALEVPDDSMLPIYRPGDRLIVSPSEQIRPGDRVVVCRNDGSLVAGRLERQTAKILEITPLRAGAERMVFNLPELAWTARVIWASQ